MPSSYVTNNCEFKLLPFCKNKPPIHKICSDKKYSSIVLCIAVTVSNCCVININCTYCKILLSIGIHIGVFLLLYRLSTTGMSGTCTVNTQSTSICMHISYLPHNVQGNRLTPPATSHTSQQFATLPQGSSTTQRPPSNISSLEGLQLQQIAVVCSPKCCQRAWDRQEISSRFASELVQ